MADTNYIRVPKAIAWAGFVLVISGILFHFNYRANLMTDQTRENTAQIKANQVSIQETLTAVKILASQLQNHIEVDKKQGIIK